MGRLLRLLKSDFTSGEVDPLLKARTDIKHYFSGAETMRNVIVLPQGGFKDRPGLKFLRDVTDLTGYGSPADGAKFINFSFDTDNTYMLLFLEEEFQVFKDGEHIHTESGAPWLGADLALMTYTQSNDTLILFHPEIQPQVITRITDTNWNIAALSFDFIPKYDYVPASSNPSGTLTPSAATGQVKLTSSASVWVSGHLNQYVEGNGGLARIVQINSSSVAVAVVEIAFYNTDAIANGDWELKSGFEDVWSNTRGWPACGTFHDGRLWMGGGPRPSTLYGSRVKEFYDFEPGTGLDDEPIELTLDTDELNSIVGLFSLRDLIIFTTGGEFYISEKPITPNSGTAIQATRRGSKVGLRQLELDGAVLFIQRGGKAVREFALLEDGSSNYAADNLSLLSSHMIKDPIDFSKRRATSTEENDLLVLVNNDGTASLCSTARSQQVVAWSTMDTPNGEIIAAGVDDQDIYFLILRQVDNASVYFVEIFDRGLRVDCGVHVETDLSPTETIVAAHLANEDVHVYSDNNYQGIISLDASGEGEIDNTSDDYYQAGYFFEVEAVTLSVEPTLQEGTTFGKKKRIVEIYSELSETEHIVLNDRECIFTTLGNAGSGSPLDVDPEPFTGRHTERGFLGYSDKAQVTISKNRPGKMCVLGVGIKISV